MTPTVTSRRRPRLVLAWAASAALVAVLVLVQAALAGQALFGTAGIAIHGYVANASFAVGLLGAVLAGVARLPRWLLVTAALVLMTLFAQVGLGYAGRKSLAAASWHVPLGVAVFGLTTVQLAGAVPLARASMGASSPASAAPGPPA